MTKLVFYVIYVGIVLGIRDTYSLNCPTLFARVPNAFNTVTNLFKDTINALIHITAKIQK